MTVLEREYTVKIDKVLHKAPLIHDNLLYTYNIYLRVLYVAEMIISSDRNII